MIPAASSSNKDVKKDNGNSKPAVPKDNTDSSSSSMQKIQFDFGFDFRFSDGNRSSR